MTLTFPLWMMTKTTNHSLSRVVTNLRWFQWEDVSWMFRECFVNVSWIVNLDLPNTEVRSWHRSVCQDLPWGVKNPDILTLGFELLKARPLNGSMEATTSEVFCYVHTHNYFREIFNTYREHQYTNRVIYYSHVIIVYYISYNREQQCTDLTYFFTITGLFTR